MEQKDSSSIATSRVVWFLAFFFWKRYDNFWILNILKNSKILFIKNVSEIKYRYWFIN